jgi:hypothetical protein
MIGGLDALETDSTANPADVRRQKTTRTHDIFRIRSRCFIRIPALKLPLTEAASI